MRLHVGLAITILLQWVALGWSTVGFKNQRKPRHSRWSTDVHTWVDQTRMRSMHTFAITSTRLSKRGVVMCKNIHCVFFFPAILLIVRCIKTRNPQSKESCIQNPTYGNSKTWTWALQGGSVSHGLEYILSKIVWTTKHTHFGSFSTGNLSIMSWIDISGFLEPLISIRTGCWLVTPGLSEQVGSLMTSAPSKPEHFLHLPPHKVETRVFR